MLHLPSSAAAADSCSFLLVPIWQWNQGNPSLTQRSRLLGVDVLPSALITTLADLYWYGG